MRIGFIGTGLMGTPMVHRLLAAHIPVTVYNRTSTKTAPLVAAGASSATTPADVLRHTDCTILMLSDALAIRQTILTPDAHPHLTQHTIIQMGTIAPTESQQLAQQIDAVGGTYLEAPVLGSIPEATAGTLIIMVGGSVQHYEQWQQLLRHMGNTIHYIGAVGDAATTKLALNQLIGSLTTAFALSLGLVMRRGVSVDTFMDIVRSSALYAPTFDKKRSRMQTNTYSNANFPVKHMLKDMRLVEHVAAQYNLSAETVTAICTLLETTIARGHAESDYSALFSTVVSQQQHEIDTRDTPHTTESAITS